MITRIYLFPVVLIILVTATFIIAYTIAVLHGHMSPLWLFISDVGTKAPESCIFGQLVNVVAVLMAVCIYLRHREIVEFYGKCAKQYRWRLLGSRITLWIGYGSSFGCSMVGNFQQNRWFLMHGVGALGFFGLGILYCWIQTWFSYVMGTVLAKRWIAHVRLLLALSSTGFFFSMLSCGIVPNDGSAIHDLVINDSFNSDFSSSSDNATNVLIPVEIPQNDPTYICTTVSEWTLVSCIMLYLLTFAAELRRASFFPPRLVLNIDEAQLPHGDSRDAEKHDNQELQPICS